MQALVIKIKLNELHPLHKDGATYVPHAYYMLIQYRKKLSEFLS